jgi:hypothetical protein
MKRNKVYPFFSLEHAFIDDDSKLAIVYAKYLETLFDATRTSWDSWMSLSEAKSEFKESRVLTSSFILYNKLLVWQSFLSIIDSAKESIKNINLFEQEYNSDLINYAAQNRIECIKEYGGGDDDDYNEDGSVRFSIKEDDLAPYTLKKDLSIHIDIEMSDCRGEKIGSSTIEDMDYTNIFVKNATEFSFFKFLRENGSSTQLTVLCPDGTMKPVTMADEIEREMNEDITNENTIEIVAKTLEYGRLIADHLNKAPITGSPNAYFEVRTMLQNLLDVSF